MESTTGEWSVKPVKARISGYSPGILSCFADIQ
jgi:hypothetical protein